MPRWLTWFFFFFLSIVSLLYVWKWWNWNQLISHKSIMWKKKRSEVFEGIAHFVKIYITIKANGFHNFLRLCCCFMTVMLCSLNLLSPVSFCPVVSLLTGQKCPARRTIKDIDHWWQDWALVSSPLLLLSVTKLEPPETNRFVDWQKVNTHSEQTVGESLLIKRIWGKSRYMQPLMSPGNGWSCAAEEPLLWLTAEWESCRERWVFPVCSAGRHWQELTSAQRGHCAAHSSLRTMGYHGNELYEHYAEKRVYI